MIPNDIFLKISNKKDLYDSTLKSADKYLLNRTNAKANDLDSVRAYAGNKVFSKKQEFCSEFNLDINKPIVFVMLHAFNDFPHHFKNNIFLDYYHWFEETLKIAKINTNVNWVFKEHPSSELYPDNSNLKGIFSFVDNNNIVFFDRFMNFNNKSIITCADTIITCVGTSGLEFSCYGIPAILGGQNHYTGYGICDEPSSTRI